MDLSVVTGTYNRLPHLQRMVESVRESVGVGIEYEIVLVDGGSTDGTIDWCKTQPDIVLIEQGELLGAIKAFNAGLYMAKGTYAVVGNDDVLYEGDTLTTALAFMQDNPNVGVGCFFQDRDHPGQYSLSYMPAVVNDMQHQHLYGQVCIVPTWLGNKVGWWGNFPDMRTYGGDNNLSCFVLELGYRVTGIECACITDLKVDDQLRQINNQQQVAKSRHRGGHPDSVAWGLHWTHKNGLCGPIVKMEPQVPNPLKRETRWLYLPIYEVGHTEQHKQKHGLRDALANHGMVYEIDWEHVVSKMGHKYMANYLMDILDSWKPDVLLTQIHGPTPHLFNADFVRHVRNEFPNFLWVNWNGDYHPDQLFSTDSLAMLKQFDLQCVVTTEVRDVYSKAGVPWMYWQIGYEVADAEPDSSTPKHDIVFLGSGYSDKRVRLGQMLRSLGHNTGLYGSWGYGGIQADGYNLYDFNAGRKLYRNAKVSIGDAQWNDKAAGYVSNRLFQALAAGGAMLMHQRVPDLDKLLGLVDGEHYIVWEDLEDLEKKLDYWLDPAQDEERQAIADAGTEFVLEHHSFDARVGELAEVLCL